MKTNVSKEECAVVCMLVSNPGGSFRKDGDGWQKRANDLIRALRDDLDEAEARAERLLELIKRAWPIAMKHEATRPCLEWLRDAGAELGAAIAETEKEKP